MPTKNSIHDLVFEERDTQIFRIPDVKTKLSTLQNYFFPRMDTLLRHTLDVITEVYDVNPYERMGFVHRPNHRGNAKENVDYGEVHIGVSGKKTKNPLKIFRKNGTPFYYHPAHLTFNVLPNGTIHVELKPFIYCVSDEYVTLVSELIEKNSAILTPLLSLANISHRSWVSCCELQPLYKSILPSSGIRLVSPRYYFPVESERGLTELILAFTLLYALLESFACIAEGREPELEKMLNQFRRWYRMQYANKTTVQRSLENEGDIEFTEIPELDSYSFVRAGKWWAVLARDKWRCLSCGRSASKDNVLLEVDHIIPRSKGGSDELDNLQTLCKKCNIGKSNKDSTRL